MCSIERNIGAINAFLCQYKRIILNKYDKNGGLKIYEFSEE